jgi:hypothetical protein
MKQLRTTLFTIMAATLLFSCGGSTCDQKFPNNATLLLLVTDKTTGRAQFSFGSPTIPDSIRITNQATGTRLFAGAVGDSVIYTDAYTRTDGVTDNLILRIGARKPDTISLSIMKESISGCNSGYSYFRFAGIKLNNTVACSANCDNALVKIPQ